MDLWFLQAGILRRRRRRGSADTSLETLVHGSPRDSDAGDGLDASLVFSLRLARALLSYAMPAHRVEEALERLADALGFDIEAMCTPTSLMVTMSDAHNVRTRVVRVEPGGTDLERLSALHELVGRVERRELTPGDAAKRIDAILARPPRFGPVATIGAYALASGASALLLGGAGLDIPFAALLGLLVGVLDALAGRFAGLGRLLPALAAFTVSFLGAAIASSGFQVRPSVLLIASIIVLLPGLTVTTATMELAQAHLVSGTARLVGGAVTFLQLGFGVALGRKAAEILPQLPRPHDAPDLPGWASLIAPFAAALAFMVLLRVKPGDLGWMLLAVATALLGSRIGGELVGAELGAFVGATLVASVAHVFARLKDRPVSLMIVPGILFLVPGSIGFLSIRSLLENDVAGAVGTAFRMFLVAMALAAGLLVATAAVPPRRAL